MGTKNTRGEGGTDYHPARFPDASGPQEHWDELTATIVDKLSLVGDFSDEQKRRFCDRIRTEIGLYNSQSRLGADQTRGDIQDRLESLQRHLSATRLVLDNLPGTAERLIHGNGGPDPEGLQSLAASLRDLEGALPSARNAAKSLTKSSDPAGILLTLGVAKAFLLDLGIRPTNSEESAFGLVLSSVTKSAAFSVVCEPLRASSQVGPDTRLLLDPQDADYASLRPPEGRHLVLLVNIHGAPIRHWHVEASGLDHEDLGARRRVAIRRLKEDFAADYVLAVMREMADSQGFVSDSVQGIARRARMDIGTVEQAVVALKSAEKVAREAGEASHIKLI